MSDSDDQNISLEQLGSSPDQTASSPEYTRTRLMSLNKVGIWSCLKLNMIFNKFLRVIARIRPD